MDSIGEYHDTISGKAIVGLKIPTDVPLIHEPDDAINPIYNYYLSNLLGVALDAAAVASLREVMYVRMALTESQPL